VLKGRHILLGITGSIAAYKAAMLIRLLVKEGAEVKVIMTPMAKHFITPLTVATLSKNPILVDFYNPENGDWNSHISLGIWTDLYIIAPASANTIAKMASGIADNLLLTSYLSSRAPVMVAPAMDMDMFIHPSTQQNIDILRRRGVEIIEPASGELASGLDGKGRMEEPENIVAYIKKILSTKSGVSEIYGTNREDSVSKSSLCSKKVLITAGPTVEQIDAVRFISNNSSGKMGYAIAKEFILRGAEVTLVSGPVHETIESANLVNVKSAGQMYDKTIEIYKKGVDIVVLAAAVADYTPAVTVDGKMKKREKNLTIELLPTQDIAASLGEIKSDKTLHIGFALETDNEETNAKEKLKKKRFDAIVLNSLKDEGAGFSVDTNKITIIAPDGTQTAYELKSKQEVAKDIVDYIEKIAIC
jgi:phosphopantothenoylcysteine decarboxylase/phosphopantothenate--cysteine ligase, prokaryotic